MKRMLIQTQLSNYDREGKFILEADSGWQMCMGRVREMLKLVPDLYIDIMGPMRDEDDMDRQGQLITRPDAINPDLWNKHGEQGDGRLRYVPHYIIPNALATRYDFDFEMISWALGLKEHKHDTTVRYDIVYLNDPLHLRAFKALFMLHGGYRPKFVVHSHFIDNPTCPKFPVEASLWMGQVESARKADVNFWQCESAMYTFFHDMEAEYQPGIVKGVKARSFPWDDGYSREEINTPINFNNLRFDPLDAIRRIGGGEKRARVAIFVPNRIGGRLPGEDTDRSSDYTRCGKFMFEVLPKLRERRQDFVVIAGNPSQKFLNNELEKVCGPNGYINLVPDALNRDEFKFIAKNSTIAVGLYDADTYGGTAARECVELGCLPLWCDCNEYRRLAGAAKYPFLCNTDMSDIVDVTSRLLDSIDPDLSPWLMNEALRRCVRERCSYEATTPIALERLGLL